MGSKEEALFFVSSLSSGRQGPSLTASPRHTHTHQAASGCHNTHWAKAMWLLTHTVWLLLVPSLSLSHSLSLSFGITHTHTHSLNTLCTLSLSWLSCPVSLAPNTWAQGAHSSGRRNAVLFEKTCRNVQLTRELVGKQGGEKRGEHSEGASPRRRAAVYSLTLDLLFTSQH